MWKVGDNVLIGEYTHTIDPKGRVNFPAKLLRHFGERFIVTKGLDNSLFVYSLEEWSILEAKINAMPMSKARALQRFLFAGAVEIEPDKQGRILIPQNLRDFAGLQKDVMIIGASNRAEIWDKNAYEAASEELTADMVADAMDELGF